MTPYKIQFSDKMYTDNSSKIIKNKELTVSDTCYIYLKPTDKSSNITTDCDYTATISSKYNSYATISSTAEPLRFIIKANALKNGKKTSIPITFKCNQNNKKATFTIKIVPITQ